MSDELNRNRRFQFSLKELLAMTVASGAMAGLFVSVLSYYTVETTTILVYTLAILTTFVIGSCVSAGYLKEGMRIAVVAFIWVMLCLEGLAFSSIIIRPKMAGNETDTARICKLFCDAENSYATADRNKDGILEFAQTLHDLYETKPGAADLKLIPKTLSEAENVNGSAKAHNGYYYRILLA